MLSTSWMPAHSSTARTGPPAITPVPGAAGRRSTTPAAFSPWTGCGMVPWMRGTLKKLLLGLLDTLGDRGRDLLGLAVADADHAVAVADDHQGGEAEATTTLDDLGDAVDRDDALDVGALVGTVSPRRLSRPPRRSPPARPSALGSAHEFYLFRFLSSLGSIRRSGRPRGRRPRGPRRDRGTCCRRGRRPRPRHPAVFARSATSSPTLRALAVLSPVDRADVGLHGRGGRERLADQVVDDLHGDVLRGARHDEARTLRGAADLLASADLATRARRDASRGVLASLECDRHRHLPAFPTLRRMCSPA